MYSPVSLFVDSLFFSFQQFWFGVFLSSFFSALTPHPPCHSTQWCFPKSSLLIFKLMFHVLKVVGMENSFLFLCSRLIYMKDIVVTLTFSLFGWTPVHSVFFVLFQIFFFFPSQMSCFSNSVMFLLLLLGFFPIDLFWNLLKTGYSIMLEALSAMSRTELLLLDSHICSLYTLIWYFAFSITEIFLVCKIYFQFSLPASWHVCPS